MALSGGKSGHKLEVFCDTSLGIAEVFGGLDIKPTEVIIRTSSPDVFLTPTPFPVEDLFETISPRKRHEYMLAGGALTLDIYRKMGKKDLPQTIRVLVARVGHRVHKKLYKALALKRADFFEPRLIISVDTGKPSLNKLLNPPWRDFLEKNLRAEEKIIQIPVARDQWGKLPLSHRYRHLTAIQWEDILWKISQLRILHLREPRKGRVSIIVGSNLTRDVCGYLMLDGYQINYPVKSFDAIRRLGDEFTIDSNKAADELFDRSFGIAKAVFLQFMSAWFEHELVEPGVRMLREELLSDLQSFSHFKRVWHNELGSANPKSVFTRSPVGPELISLVQVCRDREIPVISGQHGVSREIEATYHDCRSVVYENTLTDIFFAYNDASVEAGNLSPFRYGKSIVAGLSRDYTRVMKRRAPRVKKGILYVSTALLSGNINMLKGSFTDIDRVQFEWEMVKQVFSTLNDKVVYKAYHSGTARYPEEKFLREHIANYPQIEYFDEPLELVDFPIKKHRLIISCRATSSIAWCLMAGTPLLVINFPRESPFKSSVEAELRKSVFFLSADDYEFFRKVRELCNMDPERLIERWSAKKDHRKAFLEKYVSGPTTINTRKIAKSFAKFTAN